MDERTITVRDGCSPRASGGRGSVGPDVARPIPRHIRYSAWQAGPPMRVPFPCSWRYAVSMVAVSAVGKLSVNCPHMILDRHAGRGIRGKQPKICL